jgi:hypothetical protein
MSASIARRNASARPSLRSAAISPIADVMSFTVALESTAQWETSRARAWAYMKALARPDSACAPEASHAAVSQADTIEPARRSPTMDGEN